MGQLLVSTMLSLHTKLANIPSLQHVHSSSVDSGCSWAVLEHGTSLAKKLWLFSVEFTPTNHTPPKPSKREPQLYPSKDWEPPC